MIKRLLLVSLSVLALETFAQSGETTVLWQGEASLSWDESTAPHIPADKSTGIIAGDSIYITVSEISPDEDWPGCNLRSNTEVELCNIGLWDFKNDEMPIKVGAEVPYDAKVVKAFKQGFMAVGGGAVITEIAVKHTGDPSVVLPEGDNVLWFGPAHQISWSEGVEISEDKTKDIALGDNVKITVAKIDADVEWQQIAVNSWNWKEITSIPLWDDVDKTLPLVKSVEVNADNIDMFHEGFRVGGNGWWCTLVEYAKSDPLTGVVEVAVGQSAAVDIYTLQGILVRRSADSAHALDGLPSGLYIVGGKKIYK
ncbi:MAG: hypothetical protein K2L21_03675 [Muribaculaceae bacterium]|nr:hypothetical protein [Muribaculaceae bacterium]